MAKPLLPIVPLLFVSAHVSPPVPPERVTGNVSTEHHSRRVEPTTDACRVTGNIVPTKGPTPPPCESELLAADEAE